MILLSPLTLLSEGIWHGKDQWASWAVPNLISDLFLKDYILRLFRPQNLFISLWALHLSAPPVHLPIIFLFIPITESRSPRLMISFSVPGTSLHRLTSLTTTSLLPRRVKRLSTSTTGTQTASPIYRTWTVYIRGLIFLFWKPLRVTPVLEMLLLIKHDW